MGHTAGDLCSIAGASHHGPVGQLADCTSWQVAIARCTVAQGLTDHMMSELSQAIHGRAGVRCESSGM